MSFTALWRSEFAALYAGCSTKPPFAWLRLTSLVGFRFGLDGANWKKAIFYTAIDVNRLWDER